MLENNQKPQDEEVDYTFQFLRRPHWILIGLILFVSTLFFYIPIKSKVDQLLYSSITNISGCPISLEDYHFEYFLPKIVFHKLKIDKSCLGLSENLDLDKATIFFRGMGLSPFGPSFKLVTNFLDNPIEAYIIPSFNSVTVLLENESVNGKFIGKSNKIELSTLSHLFPKINIAGDLFISAAYFELGYKGRLKDISLNLASENFSLPSQKIQGLKIPKIAANKLLLQLEQNQLDSIILRKLVLGDDKSPIAAKVKGSVALNPMQLKSSKLELKSEIFVSDDFLEKFAILKMYLDQYDKKGKFYQIQAKGKVSSPKFSSAR